MGLVPGRVDALTLLVIVDDLDDVMRLRGALDEVAPGAFKVVHENTPADACRRLTACRVDAILLDLSAADTNDLLSVEAVLAVADHAPVVVMTLYENDIHALQAVHLGAQECLVKGEEGPRALARVIRHAVQRSELRRDLVEARALESYRATHDELTGLPNRALFLDRLEHQLRRAERDHLQFGVAFIDLDHFKAVNDRLGHAAGDALLKHVGEALQAGIRAGDTVARFGGDEFAVLLHDISDQADVPRVLDLLRQCVESERGPAETHHVQISMSIGWSVYPADGDTAESLLAVADSQMYAIKRLRHARQA